jgi:hypothetical protein
MKEIGNIQDLRLQLLMCIKNVGNVTYCVLKITVYEIPYTGTPTPLLCTQKSATQ